MQYELTLDSHPRITIKIMDFWEKQFHKLLLIASMLSMLSQLAALFLKGLCVGISKLCFDLKYLNYWVRYNQKNLYRFL